MHIRGALHVHTDLSHDGKLSLPKLAAFLKRRGYQFVCLSEHSEDMDEGKMLLMQYLAAQVSSQDFCVIPGIEYNCGDGLHMVGLGCDLVLDTADPVKLAWAIREAGGVAILAHPKRIQWHCQDDLVRAVNAVELWNIRYDGKFLPSMMGMRFFEEARKVNCSLLATVGHDLHATSGYYRAQTCMDVDFLGPKAILQALVTGQYSIDSLFFNSPASRDISMAARTRVQALRALLDQAVRIRGTVRGWLARANRERLGLCS